MAILSGNEISKSIKIKLKLEVEQLVIQGIRPGLAVILVGQDPASEIYVRNKHKACEDTQIVSFEHKLPAHIQQDALEALIHQLNQDPKVHGILCQFPLPAGLNEERVINTISPLKDVDGLHPENAGYLMTAKPRFVSCTPFGVVKMLEFAKVDIKGKHVVILGRSQLVGRPLSVLMSLPGKDATVTVCHSKTRLLTKMTSSADILIAAIGKPEFVTAPMVREGAVVIDVGINRVNDDLLPKGYRICGDVNYIEVAPKAEWITPVPGGVGPMTIAMLMYNTVNAARLQNNLPLLSW